MRLNPVFGIITCALSMIMLVVTLFPIRTQTTITPFDLGLNRKGTLTVTIPVRLRAGDSANVSMLVSSTPEDVDGAIPKSLDLVSRFEIGGIEIQPTGEIQAGVHPNGKLLFNWKVRTTQKAQFTGNLWLFFVETGKEPRLIFAREITLVSNRFFGLTYDLWRVIAVFGLLIGGILTLPLILHFFKH